MPEHVQQTTAAAGDLTGAYVDPVVVFTNDTIHVLKAGDTMTGNLINNGGAITVNDAASTTKAFRIKHTASGVDLAGAGSVLFLSMWDGAGFTGTQRYYLRLSTTSNTASTVGKWQWRLGGDISSGSIVHVLDADVGVVLNEIGADFDTRIEGDTDQNLLFVDASTDRVGIGTSTPASKLDVSGTIQTTGFKLPTGAAASYVLTSDINGVGTWQVSSASATTTPDYITNYLFMGA